MLEEIASIKPLETGADAEERHDIWVALKPHEAVVGDRVLVNASCFDDSEPRRPLVCGIQGTIVGIDADGDFNVNLENGSAAWIFRDRLSLLLRLTNIEVIIERINCIEIDFQRWKLQATEEIK